LAVKISVFTDLRFTKTKFPTGVGKHVTQMVTGLASVKTRIGFIAQKTISFPSGTRNSPSPSMAPMNSTLIFPVRKIGTQKPLEFAEGCLTAA
jgi:hypothetical protein